MNNYNTSAATLDVISGDLHANQKPYRVLHIFGVLQTCLSLGAIHGGDPYKLTLAALLHDCAKNVGREDTLELARTGAIALDPTDMEYPAIWHGAVAAHQARTAYGIEDDEVLQAVEHHTLGCENPSRTLQILMCADYCEPTREQRDAEQTRRIVRLDLRAGLLAILHLKIEDLIKKDQKPHPRIYKTIESLEI